MAGRLVTDRHVFTYEPNGWPAGVITGYRSGDGFALEHVIAFERGQLPALIRAGLEEVQAQGWGFLTFHLPLQFRLAPALGRLAKRMGFVVYAEDAEATYYVRYFGKPA